MELRYTFDPERFYLGTLCKHGHRWPGTDLSLRRIYLSPSGVNVNICFACDGNKQRNWLLKFVDVQGMGLPDGFSLSKSCKAGHLWNGHAMTLRDRRGKCPECEKLRSNRRSKENPRKTERRWIPELRGLSLHERRKAYKRMVREKLREQGLTAKGTIPTRINGGVAEGGRNDAVALQFALRESINNAGRCPSVARLVMNEQLRYWRENPKAKKEHDRWWRSHNWWLRYQTNPELRLYIRQKSKRRKAQMRNSVAIQLSGKQVRARFDEFENRCAFCGIDLMKLPKKHRHIEHVVPLIKGGPHALGNIVPACKSCNDSKRDHDVENWYRSQPFFSEPRWRKICRVLGWNRSAVGQLALL